MEAMRDGDRLKKLGLVREAVKAYRAAIEKFLAEGKTTHARSACRVALEIAPEDRELLSLFAELEENRQTPSPSPSPSAARPPAAKPLARIQLVAVAPAEAPAPAATPRPPTEEEKRLGLLPLDHGEELMDEDAFDRLVGRSASLAGTPRSLRSLVDPATGSISIPAFPLPAREDEEMYLDLEPVILEQERSEPTFVPRVAVDEPVAFFEDPEVENEKPTKVVR